ncbi:MAG: hypothetical protein NTU90_01030, partial [Proteobacteria bacterium]|nr:hypothetical protein [Pseudomonadota bacterium]
KEVRNLLDKYLDEQKEMAQALRENLKEFSDSVTKGETIRVEEFQAWLGNILAKQNERKDEVVSRLKEFGEEQKELALKSKEL